MELRDIAAIAAAIIALVGVLTTVTVAERRARRESRISREDAYRVNARSKLADLIVAVHTYEQCGLALSNPSDWLAEGQDRVPELTRQAAEAMVDLERALVNAELTVVDKDIQACLKGLRASTKGVDELVQEVVASFWEKRRPSAVVGQRRDRWEAYAAASLKLQSEALEKLRPTVRE
jgi:hypothetical protein